MSESAKTDAWTTTRLLDWMHQSFRQRDLESPRLLAEMLLAHVLDCERIQLYTQADRPASPEERDRLRELVRRALAHEPVQYLVRQAWFYGIQFMVDPRVLIPRPETETLVDLALQATRDAQEPPASGWLIGDVCTGSGCVAIAIARSLRTATVLATDLSSEALEVAQHNRDAVGVGDRVHLLAGNLAEPLMDHPLVSQAGGVDILTANPPYIPDDEWDAVEPNVKNHEPVLALRAGPEGIDLIAPLLGSLASVLKPGGRAFIELAASRAELVLELARRIDGLADERIIKDAAGRPRVLACAREA